MERCLVRACDWAPCLLPVLSALAQTICSSVYLRFLRRKKKGLCLCVDAFCVLFSGSISSCVWIGAAHAKAPGSGVDWRVREMRVISLPLSPRGDSADRTLPGSQPQPLIIPTARPSPLWSLTLGEEISRGRQRCVCDGERGVRSSGDAGMRQSWERVGWKREEDVKRDLGRRGRGWKENEGRRGESRRGKSLLNIVLFSTLSRAAEEEDGSTLAANSLSTSRLISLSSKAPYSKIRLVWILNEQIPLHYRIIM